jgi:glycosyltransferase involved in cell wall biosynthesis
MAQQQKSGIMKRVLTIVPYPYLPFFSGGQKLIAHFTSYLGEQCILHVAGTTNNDRALVSNYTFHPVLKNSQLRYADVSAFFRLRRIIKEQRIETVIVEHPYLGWLGWMLKKACGVKLIVHTHNVEYERFRTVGKSWWPLLKWYEGRVLRAADIVFCISTEDKKWMTEQLHIDSSKCVLVPYGITQHQIPLDKPASKQKIADLHQLDPDALLLFFNGLLDYKPNTDALQIIIEKINPLLKKSGLHYNILIAGKRLPDSFGELKQWNNDHIFYAGFVDDIDLYTKAADILLNPVNSGGGVKTKMIEALGLNTSVVATENGAAGVDVAVCGDKLRIIPHESWDLFVESIQFFAKHPKLETPHSFYKKYHWKEIVSKLISTI